MPHMLFCQASLTTLLLDDVEHVLAGRWKYGEDYIRHAVKDSTAKIASLKDKVV